MVQLPRQYGRLWTRHQPLSPHRNGGRGFTLVEFSVMLTIVAVLATLAVPQFTRLKHKARRVEALSNLSGIAMAEIAYEKTTDAFLACSESPTTNLDSNLHPFDPSQAGWMELEWAPDGWVRCHYSADLHSSDRGAWLRPTASCDLDGNGQIAQWFLDVDPYGASTESMNSILRPSPTTQAQNVF